MRHAPVWPCRRRAGPVRKPAVVQFAPNLNAIKKRRLCRRLAEQLGPCRAGWRAPSDTVQAGGRQSLMVCGSSRIASGQGKGLARIQDAGATLRQIYPQPPDQSLRAIDGHENGSGEFNWPRTGTPARMATCRLSPKIPRTVLSTGIGATKGTLSPSPGSMFNQHKSHPVDADHQAVQSGPPHRAESTAA